MTNSFPANIKIGGTITINTIEEREEVENLLQIFANSTGEKYGEPFWGTMEIKDVDGILEDGYLVGVDSEASDGEFLELEGFCQQLGVAYTRHSSPSDEYNAEIVEWRPDMEVSFIAVCDDNGDLYVPRSAVDRALDLIKEGSIQEAVAVLQKELGENIPPLEPFKIVDNAPSEDD